MAADGTARDPKAFQQALRDDPDKMAELSKVKCAHLQLLALIAEPSVHCVSHVHLVATHEAKAKATGPLGAPVEVYAGHRLISSWFSAVFAG